MKTEVNLRAFQKEDTEAIEAIIREAWHYDDLCSHKTACKLARVFLSSCLTNYTFSRVAVLNGKPVGIILVKDIARHTCPLPNRFRQLRAVLSLYLTKEGRAVSKISTDYGSLKSVKPCAFENVTGIDRELLRESGKNYPAELALFVVSPSCRGQGVGKALFQAALDYTGQQKLDEIYLFTDTSCNYGFYEHAGLHRLLGEVSLEPELVLFHILCGNHTLTGFHFFDSINKQERISVRDYLHYLLFIHKRHIQSSVILL